MNDMDENKIQQVTSSFREHQQLLRNRDSEPLDISDLTGKADHVNMSGEQVDNGLVMQQYDQLELPGGINDSVLNQRKSEMTAQLKKK